MAKRKKQQAVFDIIIAGGGLAGLTMATRLGKTNLHIAVIEHSAIKAMATQAHDGRTTALAYGSKLILESCGVWPMLADHACPIDDIAVTDQHSFLKVDFASRAQIGEPFGYIVENHIFRSALYNRVQQLKNVTLYCPATISAITPGDTHSLITLNDGTTLKTKLLIAADGKNSFCRTAAGIKSRGWSYNQTALVVTIKHDQPHANLALEHFYPGGPFAVLPMTEHRASIVWSDRPHVIEAIAAMPDDDIIELLKERGCRHLGSIALNTRPQLYPLRFMLADKLYGRRLVLIGEAAHGMHPIAGQGFNLSVRDAETLARLIESCPDDIGAPSLLKTYAQKRRRDHFAFMIATDILEKTFSNGFVPLKWARRLGLGLVQRIPPLKNAFSQMAMGLLT